MDYSKIKLPENRKGRKSKAFIIEFDNQLKAFSNNLVDLNKSEMADQKISSRGWCYLLEGFGAIDKSEFDKAQKIINNCRKLGYLPMDFVDADKNRQWFNLQDLSKKYKTPLKYLKNKLNSIKYWYGWKDDIKFWQSQKVFIQMMVEKIDVLNLFKPLCAKYKIPIANAKGWSDLLSRYNMALRFKELENLGLKCILLYYADFDPAGILIAETMKNNIKQIQKATGYDPKNLVIYKFGLNYDFIQNNNLLWIDNLTTGSGKQADERKNYVRDYVAKYGRRKCEANAILPIRDIALEHCEKTILSYLNKDAFEKWEKRVKLEYNEVKHILNRTDIHDYIDNLIPFLEIYQQERLIFNYSELIRILDKEIVLYEQEKLIFNFINLIKKIIVTPRIKQKKKKLTLEEQAQKLQDCYHEISSRLKDIRYYDYWSGLSLEDAYQIVLEQNHDIEKIIMIIKKDSGINNDKKEDDNKENEDDDKIVKVKVAIISESIEKVKEKAKERVRIKVR